jgi:[ribosomal protein S5]-alanine N-acetyltransferase
MLIKGVKTFVESWGMLYKNNFLTMQQGATIMTDILKLHTSRLILRTIEASDLDDLATEINDYDIARNTLNIPYPYERSMAEDFLKRIQDAQASKLGYSFAITLRGQDRLIGVIGLNSLERHKRAEAGYWLSVHHRNEGYTTEALKRIIQFGFEEMGMVRIQATHFLYNPSSGRVMEKVGMTYEGILRDYVIKWDKPENLAMYAITRADWLDSS